MGRTFGILLMLFFLMTVTLSASAQNKEGEEKVLTVHPNPAKDNIKILLHSRYSSSPEIQIIDLTGKIAKKFNDNILADSNTFRAELDISDLKSGIYFVKLIQKEEIYTSKLIVK
jgi:hypothetical protein